MKRYNILALSLLYIMTGCTSNPRSENPEQWTQAEVNEWFDEKEWLGSTQLQPDASIDKKELATRYHGNKERWSKAFAFLKRDDLSILEPGNHEIDGKDVYAIISQYHSKNAEDAQYESHKKYTDIQYVISGQEYIGRSDLAGSTLKIPYSEEKDIQFHNVSDGKPLLAQPGIFFIFFPGDGHSPGMKVEENAPIRKMVIKVRG